MVCCGKIENGDIQFFLLGTSATVGRPGAGKTEPQEQQQLGTAMRPMDAAVEVSHANSARSCSTFIPAKAKRHLVELWVELKQSCLAALTGTCGN